MREIDLNPLDEHFARKMNELAGADPDQAVFNAARLVCNESANGHVCLDLDQFSGQKVLIRYQDTESIVSIPDLTDWLRTLENNILVGQFEEVKPLILDKVHHRLYLRRYWQYERHLVDSFRKFASSTQLLPESEKADQLLEQLNPPTADNNDQRQAIQLAMQSQLCIITGGPGTGKTTTIVNIMVVLLAADPEIRIVLTAPTGKAAARLSASVSEGKERLKGTIPVEIWNKISEETHTIHRLLKSKRNSIYFRHDALNLLPMDCLILDEVSMVDMALMSKLIQSLPDDCRLILLGDANQLSSVEAGAVFGDLCGTESIQLQNKVVQLKKSHRFDPDKGIGRLSEQVLAGKGGEGYHYLNTGDDSRISWYSLPEPELLPTFIEKTILPKAEALLDSDTIESAFKRLKSFMVLTALRVGPYGSLNLNILVEDLLAQMGKIPAATDWYHGKPILITRNDYGMDLFNGDLGICFRDPEENRLSVYFEKQNGYRQVSPARLPAYESVYALTIHKSQGSEFDQIILMLPEKENELLTRELIYTAITRARNSLQVVGNEQVFIDSVSKKIRRSSGLKEGLDTII